MSRAPRPTGTPSCAWTAPSRTSHSFGGRPRLDEHLEAVLAGVAGPGDEGRDAGDGALGDRVVAQARRGRRRSAARRTSIGPRALDGEQPGRQRAVVEHRLERDEALGERVGDDRGVAGVGDDQEPRVGQAVDDQVVDDPAVGAQIIE